jgi:hypothetical protein
LLLIPKLQNFPLDFATFWTSTLTQSRISTQAQFYANVTGNSEPSAISSDSNERLGVVGEAIVAHYGYAPQRAGLDASDVLDRYRLLAQGANNSLCTLLETV